MEKLKFLQHLEWKENESLAGKLWRLEKEYQVSGLKEEVEKYIVKYSLPAPSRMMSMVQYKTVLKEAIKLESRNEVRILMMESSKLRYLVGWDQARAPQMGMTDLKRIQSITRSRLSAHYAFSADFGSGKRCSCGELDTFGHVRRGCHLYHDLLPETYETYNSVEGAEAVYDSILARKEEINAERNIPSPENIVSY